MRTLTSDSEADQLATIHAACFTDAWTSAGIAALLRTPGTFAMVVEDDLGLILVRVAGDESEILTVGVTPAARRRGLGSQLVFEAANHAALLGAKVMFLEVNCGNSPAIALYKRLGFAVVGRRRGYYQIANNVKEDALVLRVEIPLGRVGNCMQLG